MLNIQTKSIGNTLLSPRRTVPRFARATDRAVASPPHAMQMSVIGGVNKVTNSSHYPGIVSLAIIILGGVGAWMGVIGIVSLFV
jgi:hypothetical protein